MKAGFLGTAAPFHADLTLVIEVAMGLALLTGMALARRRRYREHAWCQSVIVLLNLALIALVMIPSFRQITPVIFTRLGRPYYAIAAVHATLGSITELLGLYVLFAAGTNVLPKRLRFRRYKLWMRTTLVLWWLVLVLGLGTYARWYVMPLLHK